MTTKIAPAKPLPWMTLSGGHVTTTAGPDWPSHVVVDAENERDALYISKAANAYPRLVAHLRAVLNLAYPIGAEDFEQNVAIEERDAYALLRELGELDA